MTSKERREREREETREKFLASARELFATQGYEAVKMRDVAERIQYTATAIYKHFADKEALLRELCDLDFRALRDAFERIAHVADPVERLRELGMAYVEFARTHPNHYKLLFMGHKPPDATKHSKIEHGNPDQDAYAFLKGTVAACIAAERFREEFTDADLVAQAMWSGVHGLVSLTMVHENNDWIDWRPVETTARVVIDLQLRGLLR
jgi:AcrR family transcriptional regulator